MMPIRLTCRGPFVITYDSLSSRWVTIKGMAISVLSQYDDVEPGTTLGRVFDIVDSETKSSSGFWACIVGVILTQFTNGLV